jgi:prolyl-tRNA synthetase
VVIVPIWKSDADRASTVETAQRLRRDLERAGVRVEVDAREGMKPGAKYYEWEGRGVPLRLEIGPRDVAQGQAMAARRIGGKQPVPLAEASVAVPQLLDGIQTELLARARARRDEHSVRGVTRQQLIERMEADAGFAYAGFCGDPACEQAIKERTKATVRVLPDPEFRTPEAPTRCVWCDRPAVAEAVWARAY